MSTSDLGMSYPLEWKYVKVRSLPHSIQVSAPVQPIPRHTICNIGDATVILSAGILHSNLHRVVPPPKAQASFDQESRQREPQRPGTQQVPRLENGSGAAFRTGVLRIKRHKNTAPIALIKNDPSTINDVAPLGVVDEVGEGEVFDEVEKVNEVKEDEVVDEGEEGGVAVDVPTVGKTVGIPTDEDNAAPTALAAAWNAAKEFVPDASHATPPPLSDDVPTVPPLVIDHALLQAGDEREFDRLWKGATELGFWYLKNHGTDAEVNAVLEMGTHTMALPLDEKMKFEQGDGGNSFGYKFAGSNATDASGALGSVEFIHISQDDALAFPTVVHRRYPRTVEERMDSAVHLFVRKSMEVNQTLIDVLNDRLGLPLGRLAELHGPEESSGSEARCIKKTSASTPDAPDKAAIGAHTDFGSLTFLHNRLGGLQVLPPGTDEWKYVKCPDMPFAISATRWRSSALASCARIFIESPPPKAQASFDRWSLAFFTRPRNSVLVAPLVKERTLITEAAARAPEGQYATGSTAGEWFWRRVQNRRIKNQRRLGWRAVERRVCTEPFALAFLKFVLEFVRCGRSQIHAFPREIRAHK
ncbi:hypothetical protein EDB92DRAFT_2111485 [Lactarius akahatsu]|uniref:Non-haem dioxygenase N-terminal domain-containing protein n=1 Tax=Lactarius akahatsu TaxID=416441 RepID=A0AAD4QC80_9AGAM|nr:hypothetical protein EDB92DRAFT_2111485 [Lactarius akahatsu]